MKLAKSKVTTGRVDHDISARKVIKAELAALNFIIDLHNSAVDRGDVMSETALMFAARGVALHLELPLTWKNGKDVPVE